MREFEPYLNFLESLIDQRTARTELGNLSDKIEAALDGQPAAELRRLVPLGDLRESGAFFTGSDLSRIALEPLTSTLDDNSIILDPACGAGDLLIACARRLSTDNEGARTLERWGTQLMGRDLHPEFVRATKLRLVLASMREGASLDGNQSLTDFEGMLPGIEQRSGLSDIEAIGRATHIVVNPPFTYVEAPARCAWASGKVNAAALFLQACVTHARPGTKVVAILPDVVRSGSRYQKWRRAITSKAVIQRLELYGQFDRWADVDVFVIELQVTDTAKGSTSCWGQPVSGTANRLKDFCEVRVGPVVDNRDPRRGPWHSFIKSRNLPAWQTLEPTAPKRRFKGPVLEPPFVVVRRTSRVGDKHRAVGTIVGGNKPVAVENHLIVLTPRDGTIRTCHRILSVLANAATTNWLDQRIRCRHLTVSSLKELPWWDG